MKVIILAGGFGTRLAEHTDIIPKPMVEVGNRPILWHIMHLYAGFGHKDFLLALGYRAHVIKKYFLNYYSLSSDFTVDLSDGSIEHHQKEAVDWKVTLVDTGLNTMTGGRVRRMKDYAGSETTMLTYGDGLSDIDVAKLLKFHRSHGKMVTISAVRPAARFGDLEIGDDSRVNSFKEKPQTGQGWINGGFFVLEPGFFNLIDGDDTVLEEAPLEKAAAMGELTAYRHDGFWQCMDTVRDRNILETLWQSGNPPWKI